MRTKVTITGDQPLGDKIAQVIEKHFEVEKREKLHSIYLTIKKERLPNPNPLNPDTEPDTVRNIYPCGER